MEIKGLLPILIPGALLQLSIQVFYIRKCLRDNRLTPSRRRLYGVMILVFNLPAAAFYLFNSGGKSPDAVMWDEEENVATHIRRGIFLLLVTAYEVMGLHMLAENMESALYLPLVTLFTLSFLFMLLYNFLPGEHTFAGNGILPALHLLLCVPILYLDVSGDNLFLALIAGISAINQAPLPRAKIYGIGALGAYLVGSTAKTIFLFGTSEMSQLVRYFFVNTLVVMLALIAYYTLKKQMVTGKRLDIALHKVKEQAEQLKSMAIVEERNRIAAEMHDTVGHTLTAAVLSLERAEALLEKEPGQAVQKLHQGREQVRRGLSELRTSIRKIRSEDQAEFSLVLKELLQEIRRDTDLDIQLVVEGSAHLPPLQAGILLSAVKECATNAIRHGQASQVDILFQEYKGELQLAITDNGRGAEDIRSGSGLTIMAERVQSVGGNLKIETAPEEGFTINIIVPVTWRKEAPQ